MSNKINASAASDSLDNIANILALDAENTNTAPITNEENLGVQMSENG